MFNLFKKSKKNQFDDFPKAKEMRKVKIWTVEKIRRKILRSRGKREFKLYGELTDEALDLLEEKGYTVEIYINMWNSNGIPVCEVDEPYFTIKR